MGTRKHTVFISLPMSGLSEILVKRNILAAKNAYLAVSKRDIETVAFIDNFGCEPPDMLINHGTEGVYYLGKALVALSKCDEAFFWVGWEDARGCQIEHEVCVKYNIPYISIEQEGRREMGWTT